MTTKVGKTTVRVDDLQSVKILRFSDGVYAFWTCVFKGEKYLPRIARALVGLEAGERFTRFDSDSRSRKIPKAARLAYAKAWKEEFRQGLNVAYIRPSTNGEILFWLSVHPKDANALEFGSDVGDSDL